MLNPLKLHNTYFAIRGYLHKSQQLLGAAFVSSSHSVCLLRIVVGELTTKLALSFVRRSSSRFDRVLLLYAQSFAWIETQLVLERLTKLESIRLL